MKGTKDNDAAIKLRSAHREVQAASCDASRMGRKREVSDGESEACGVVGLRGTMPEPGTE